MNRSGEAIDVDTQDADSVIVIYDDISLPFGEIRLSKNRGDGGHNGIKSIEQALKTRSFIRFRVGVAPTDIFGRIRIPRGGKARTNYLVAKKLSPSKRKHYADLAKRIDVFLTLIISHGYEYAVSKQGDL
jgi:PTH1 family peptidyl-tRNA hydrolase